MPSGKNSSLKKQVMSFEFRKEFFPIVYHTWVDNDNGEEFTTQELDELNQAQLHNQYRSKYGVPFVDEIRTIREQYGLSASKMSEILGLGPNVYRNYENGEMPGITTGRLIQLSKDPVEFKKLIDLSSNELEAQEIERINKKVAGKLTDWDKMEYLIEERLFGTKAPTNYNGYRVPSLGKIGMMAKYFAQQLKPFKTKMNKLLFYADFLHYSKTGYSISGMTYVTISHGPVPKNYGGIYDRLSEEGYVDIEEVEFDDYGGEKFLNHGGEADMGFFLESERLVIEIVQQKLGRLKTVDIVNISHDELAWQQNIDQHGRISYDYGFSLYHVD
jgi:transcriptional regulator with XRE-family HTH domain